MRHAVRFETSWPGQYSGVNLWYLIKGACCVTVMTVASSAAYAVYRNLYSSHAWLI